MGLADNIYITQKCVCVYMYPEICIGMTLFIIISTIDNSVNRIGLFIHHDGYVHE